MGLHTPKHTTPRGLKGLERAGRWPRRLWRKWRRKRDGRRSEQEGKRGERVGNEAVFIAKNLLLSLASAKPEHGPDDLPGMDEPTHMQQ